MPAGDASASAVIGVREDALYAPTQTAALTAIHLGTQIGSAELTLTDDDAPPVMTIAVSASAAASDTRMDAITINEGGGFHLEITLDRGFATFQPPLGSAVTVTAPPGTFNTGDLAAMPPSFARDIRTFGTIINSTDNTTAAGAVDAVFAIAPDADGSYTAGTPASATVRILDNDAVPTMPRNLTAKDDDREVALRWELPESYDDIELTGYQYRARERGGGWRPDWTRIPGSGATTSHTVTGLTNGTEYTFEVRGINSKGGGPAASVKGTPLEVGIRIANHSVEEGESTTLRILPPGAPFDAGVEKVLTVVLASRGGADRAGIATDYILRRGTTSLGHSDRAFDELGLAGVQPHFTLPMPALLDELTLTLETVEDEVAECREEIFAYAWIHDATDPANRTRIDADPRRSDNIFIEDDDPHAKLESARIDGATVTLTFDRVIDQTETAGPGHPDHDPGYLPLPPRSYFSIWRGGSTAPAWGGASGIPLNVAWRSSGPGPAAGTDANSFVLAGRTVSLTFPEPVAEGENAWLAYQRSGRLAPLGKATEGRCRKAVPKFVTVLTNATATAGGSTPPAILIADSEGFERAQASVDFAVTLDRASTGTVTVDYSTSAGTATAGADYTATSGIVTFAPGDTAKTISVPIIDDRVEDGGETFTVTLSNPTNATLGNRTATGTIHNNDDDERVAVANRPATGLPTVSGTARVGETLTASVSEIADADGLDNAVFSHQWIRTGGTETATDIESATGSAYALADADAGVTIAVRVTFEDDGGTRETLVSAATETVAAAPEEVEPPALGVLSAADAEASEEDDATLDFAVTLAPAADAAVTVDYATSDGTATAGADYTAASGTLTFQPGDTSKTVSVAIADDAEDDGGETLTLTLANAAGAEIGVAAATGIIRDDDGNRLTARFEAVPAEHDGTTFVFDVRFSEDPAVSYLVLRDESFDVTGGAVVKARRKDGRDDLREIHVEPSGHGDVTVSLPPTTDCDAVGAICTADGRPLSNANSATVPGQAASAVANGPVLTLAWPTPRDGFAAPHGADFAVRVDGSLRAVSSASLWTHGAVLLMAEPVLAGEEVVVDYLGSAMHALRDAAGGTEPAWRDLAAVNVTGLAEAGADALPTEGAARAMPVDALSLSLAGRELDDAGLAALAARTDLRRLDLSGNGLTDLSALAPLRALRSLDLSANAVSDLSPLAGMTELRRLDLAGNRVVDLWPLGALPHLEVLLLDGNDVADVGALTHLYRLENLGLSGNRIGDVSPLADLGSLRRLDLGGNPVGDLSAVGDLGTLVWLRLPAADEGAPTHRLVRLRWLLAPNAAGACLGCGNGAPGHAEAR